MNRFRLGGELKALLFTLPAMVPLTLFWFVPLGYVVYLSFMEWDFMSPDKLFVGLDNYRNLLVDPAFYQALRVTALFCLGSVIPVIVIGLSPALHLLCRRERLHRQLRPLAAMALERSGCAGGSGHRR